MLLGSMFLFDAATKQISNTHPTKNRNLFGMYGYWQWVGIVLFFVALGAILRWCFYRRQYHFQQQQVQNVVYVVDDQQQPVATYTAYDAATTYPAYQYGSQQQPVMGIPVPAGHYVSPS